jgi:hypothetical protein
MVKTGTLDKYGRANEKTPANWKEGYIDYSASTTDRASETINVSHLSYFSSFLMVDEKNSLSFGIIRWLDPTERSTSGSETQAKAESR